MNKDSVTQRFRALSTGASQRRPRSEGPLPHNPVALEAFLATALIQDDPAPPLRAIGQALREPTQERQVLYLRDTAQKWSVEKDVEGETVHQETISRWRAIHTMQRIGRQFLVPPHESWAVQEAAKGVMSQCETPETRKSGLTPTEMLRQHLLVLNMAYVTLHHEQRLLSSGSPKKKKGVLPLFGHSPVVKNVPVEAQPVSMNPPVPPNDFVARSHSDAGQRRPHRSSWGAKVALPKLPLGPSAPFGTTHSPISPGAGEAPAEEVPVSVSRRTRQQDPKLPSSGRSSPTKPRVTVRFKSLESMEPPAVSNDAPLRNEEPLRPRPRASTPLYTKVYASGGSRRHSLGPTHTHSGAHAEQNAAVAAPVVRDQAPSGETPDADTREH